MRRKKKKRKNTEVKYKSFGISMPCGLIRHSSKGPSAWLPLEMFWKFMKGKNDKFIFTCCVQQINLSEVRHINNIIKVNAFSDSKYHCSDRLLLTQFKPKDLCYNHNTLCKIVPLSHYFVYKTIKIQILFWFTITIRLCPLGDCPRHRFEIFPPLCALSPVHTSNNVEATLVVECYKSNNSFDHVWTNWTCSICFDFVETRKDETSR